MSLSLTDASSVVILFSANSLSDFAVCSSSVREDILSSRLAISSSAPAFSAVRVSIVCCCSSRLPIRSSRSCASLLDQKQQTIEKLNSTVAKLEAQGSELTEERDNALLKTASMEQSLSASESEISTLTGSRDALQSQIDTAAEETQALVDETLDLGKAIEQKLSEAGIEGVRVQPIEENRAVAITLVSGSLYQTGNASLTREGREILTRVGDIVAEYSDWNIDVEGHTDSLGIGAVLREQYPTNWELSSARASAAVRHLRSKSVIDAEALSATGFADTRPIADNDNAQGREQNRRVDIVLRR